MKFSYSPKTGYRNILILFIDEDPWKEIHTTIFGRKPSLPQRCNSQEEFEEQFSILEYKASLQYALKRLSMKTHSSAELKKNLVQRCVAEDTATKVIDECMRLGYLNDQVWMEGYVRGLLSKKLGPQAIIFKLRLKGVQEDVARGVLEQFDSGDAPKRRIEGLLQSKYRSKDLTDFKSREKVIASLMRKGFSFDDIREAMQAHVQAASH